MASVGNSTAELMTTDQFLALPEDGVERELIQGELRERPMTTRNARHCEAEARLGYMLLSWLERQPAPRGKILSGEVRCRLRRNPDTTVGIDVVYISAEQSASITRKAAYVEGPPILAIEILSPSDKQEDVTEKVLEYLQAGVKLVWVADPDFQTVRVHRPGEEPVLFNSRQELTAEPDLPGFRVKVIDLFTA